MLFFSSQIEIETKKDYFFSCIYYKEKEKKEILSHDLNQKIHDGK